MSDEPADDLIRYDILVQEAMRGVVKKIISETVKAGLSGDHHFFISFQTGFPGVRLSSRMRERYPDEMTIVIQHQYWDLKVNENSFEIGLSFDDIPENLTVPFAAIRGFFDPSVQFGLQFELDEEEDESEHSVTELNAGDTKSEDDKSIPQIKPVKEKDATTAKPIKLKKKPKSGKAAKKSAGEKKPDADIKTNHADESGSAEVVSLDAFRKKP